MFRLGRPWGIGKKVYTNGEKMEGFWEKDKFVEKQPQKELEQWFQEVINEDAKQYIENVEEIALTLSGRQKIESLDKTMLAKTGEKEIEAILNYQRQDSTFSKINSVEGEQKIIKMQVQNIHEDHQDVSDSATNNLKEITYII